ncbi:MAG: GNAT family N-acetyltransferase [Flavobacteriales bacterium]|nr:GNAT family N-acetyltransferase [Flavobacteriales bacterium]
MLDYHRFRHAIYATSDQREFLSGPEGFDTDEYDATALHLGWYEHNRLVGCVRLLNPIKARHPLHLFKDLGEGPLRDAALDPVTWPGRTGSPCAK